MKCETHVLQDLTELACFIDILQKEKVRSYLEIGSKNGGSVWRIANSLPVGSRIVSVDLPHGDTSFKETQPNLEECMQTLLKRGYDSHLFLGDSTDSRLVEDVRKLGPFDACLIDANHTEPYVRKDWANYGPMCRIVAFHDIGWLRGNRSSKKMDIDVPKVWAELKKEYRHQEFKLHHTRQDNGIGVLWRS